MTSPPTLPYIPEGLITHTKCDDGRTKLTAKGAFGMDVDCYYWPVTPNRPGDDAWEYKLTPHSEKTHSGPFRHPSEHGCQIAIYRHLIDIGLVAFPEDNSHLDDTDAAIHARTLRAWDDRSILFPRVGDFMQNGDELLRFCAVRDTYAQTTKALKCSYYVGLFGDVSYSGSLDPGFDLVDLELTFEIKTGQFWFFHHGRAGGGRGVNVTLPCRVWMRSAAPGGSTKSQRSSIIDGPVRDDGAD